jgi:hypothetical protein
MLLLASALPGILCHPPHPLRARSIESGIEFGRRNSSENKFPLSGRATALRDQLSHRVEFFDFFELTSASA